MSGQTQTWAGRRQRGVTLLEALIAGVVMGAGLLALLQAHLSLHGQAEAGRLRAQAAQVAQRELERLRAGMDPLQDADGSDGVFTLQRRVADTNAGPGLRAVRVRVAWTARTGEDAAVALSALVAVPDPAFAGALTLAEPATAPRPATR
ncbi:type IV pilus modification PilV family protein [Azohydromonas aeria]|uniref:type IV pilus modification PilV family protein n=1 Tax=Azohydromonas aeria TaxID=2590212 RepID=UPI0012F9D8A7|nr:prepilin-type N-terminal cleavage/methylation domain-containing protein [Azohydromonas aeria]